MKEELLALKELARDIKLKQIETTSFRIEEKNKDEIVVIEDDLPSREGTTEITSSRYEMNKIKCKLLQFHTNYRPAYFGSWRKKSSTVRPRAPLRKDQVYIFTYQSS